MGMKRISISDENQIIKILHNWPAGRKLTWEYLRDVISKTKNCNLNKVWSRQSLGDNESIHVAFTTAKKRLLISRTTNKSKVRTNKQYENEIQELETNLDELKLKYEALLLRHTQLCYNASQLENGNHLLIDPLPDNTRSQS